RPRPLGAQDGAGDGGVGRHGGVGARGEEFVGPVEQFERGVAPGGVGGGDRGVVARGRGPHEHQCAVGVVGGVVGEGEEQLRGGVEIAVGVSAEGGAGGGFGAVGAGDDVGGFVDETRVA